eukprot:9359000-Alexandrium_andersonii.AAC.1
MVGEGRSPRQVRQAMKWAAPSLSLPLLGHTTRLRSQYSWGIWARTSIRDQHWSDPSPPPMAMHFWTS